MKDGSDKHLPSWIEGDIFVADSGHGILKAWEPWEWTRSVLFQLQNSEIDDEHPEWRLYWIAGVATLRAIGHVLKNVDANVSSAHKHAIDKIWSEWKSNSEENWIFFDFIERERNNILKEFSFGAQLPNDVDDRLLAYENTDLDAAQLFREAVYWWRYQLRQLEAMIS